VTFICGLFYDAVSSSDNKHGITMNEWTEKGVERRVRGHLKKLSWHFLGGTDENHENPWSGYPTAKSVAATRIWHGCNGESFTNARG
jgi:hypothetical protein